MIHAYSDSCQLVDSSLLVAFPWTLKKCLGDIRTRSQALQVCNCAALCAEVTSEEDAKEDAFDVLPFSVVTCEVHGTSSALTCHATCTSSRPAKTVNKPWQCMRHEEVSKIQVRVVQNGNQKVPKKHQKAISQPRRHERWNTHVSGNCPLEDPFPLQAGGFHLLLICCQGGPPMTIVYSGLPPP